MRLWHQKLIPFLDNKRLLGQHRECCALRGKGWGRKHSVVDYVFKYDLSHLYAYHSLVLNEMLKRNFRPHYQWFHRLYRGIKLDMSSLHDAGSYVSLSDTAPIYIEHDDKYLKECLLNLKEKYAQLINGQSIEHMLIDLDLKGV